MQKNLVMISLDGVSQTAFWQYHESMPNLWKLASHSIAFRRFFSTSTDCRRSFTDVAFGDAAEMDHQFSSVDSADCFAGRASNFYTNVHRHGYAIFGIRRSASQEPASFGAWPEYCGKYEIHQEREVFCRTTDKFLKAAKSSEKPFLLHFSDEAARPDDASTEKAEHVLYHNRFEAGYRLLDESIGWLLNTLAGRGQLDNTLVVAFGPFGMDPWRHGIHRGRVIGIEPYADVCWTPAFIHNYQENGGVSDQLFTTIDLKPTLMRMLFPDDVPEKQRDALVGIDILSGKRQLVLSQNMNALAREDHADFRGLVKSYAITDGDMRLMASSHGGIAGDEGMELYYDMRDPGNGRNLLDFFTFDKQGNMLEFGRSDIIHVHFTQSFRRDLVKKIALSYAELRNLMRQTIRFKEKQALELAGAGADNVVFPDQAFLRKRKWR